MALLIENPPQSHFTNIGPFQGITEKRLVITVAPHKDIWPHGKTYPIKATAINNKNKVTPVIHT